MTDNRVFMPPPIVKPATTVPSVKKTEQSGAARDGRDFQTYLNQAQELKLSSHARERLHNRQIPLSADKWARVQMAMAKIAEKGGRDSLILLGDVALLVNVPNRTVVTAVDEANMKDRIFTNIDSAIII